MPACNAFAMFWRRLGGFALVQLRSEWERGGDDCHGAALGVRVQSVAGAREDR